MDVSGGQLGEIAPSDLIEGENLIDEFHDILYRDSRTGDARFAEVAPGVNHDSVHIASRPVPRVGRTLAASPISYQYQRAVDGSTTRSFDSLRGLSLDAANHHDLDEVTLDEGVTHRMGATVTTTIAVFGLCAGGRWSIGIISVSSIMPAVRMLRSTTCSGSLTVSLMYRKA